MQDAQWQTCAMIHDHRPYFVKQIYLRYESWYARHFIAPQLESLGNNGHFMKPWHMRIHGDHIRVGDNLHVVTASDRRVVLSSWHFKEHQGHITIGDHCLLCPGVRIDSASRVTIGDSTMLAAGAYITDADWHDIYDRTRTIGATRPVTLEENVWVGDGATVCKGVTIGRNTVIGAGSVVTTDIPADVIAAGNPARVIKPLDEAKEIVSRASMFRDISELQEEIDRIDRYTLHHNSFVGWIRTLIAPRRGD